MRAVRPGRPRPRPVSQLLQHHDRVLALLRVVVRPDADLPVAERTVELDRRHVRAPHLERRDRAPRAPAARVRLAHERPADAAATRLHRRRDVQDVHLVVHEPEHDVARAPAPPAPSASTASSTFDQAWPSSRASSSRDHGCANPPRSISTTRSRSSGRIAAERDRARGQRLDGAAHQTPAPAREADRGSGCPRARAAPRARSRTWARRPLLLELRPRRLARRPGRPAAPRSASQRSTSSSPTRAAAADAALDVALHPHHPGERRDSSSSVELRRGEEARVRAPGSNCARNRATAPAATASRSTSSSPSRAASSARSIWSSSQSSAARSASRVERPGGGGRRAARRRARSRASSASFVQRDDPRRGAGRVPHDRDDLLDDARGRPRARRPRGASRRRAASMRPIVVRAHGAARRRARAGARA